MRSIDTTKAPLVFPVAEPQALYAWPDPGPERVAVRALATALTGMQKEALVFNTATGRAWRLVSDEGPYLNGSDLAPFPLAFFAVGVGYSFMAEIRALAEQRGIAIGSLALRHENRYTMEGSALQGTMVGGALPVELTAHIESPGDDEAVRALVADAVARAPVTALLAQPLTSRFTLTHNGEPVAPGRVLALDAAPLRDPEPVLEALKPAPETSRHDVIVKVQAADEVSGEGGAGSSLRAEQKRVLHMSTTTGERGDGLAEATVRLLNPIGSSFRFLGDVEASGAAPAALDYVSAGIAFCFLTQMGRFAQIAKLGLDKYRIVQDTAFGLPAAAAAEPGPPSAEPVATHVHVDSNETFADVRRVTDMSEQTCFLHAACRSRVTTKVRLARKGA